MPEEKIKFAKEKETMLLTLFPRAIQSKWKDPILLDPWAEEAIKHIDYEPTTFKGIFGKLIERWGCAMVATRAATFDMLTKRYLEEHPDAIVLYLGCGMDSRVYRVDPPATVAWYNVDYPDVIDLYRKLYPEKPGLHLIGASLENVSWLEDLPKYRPVLVMGEGVFMYLTEANVKALLNAITGHFPQGEIIFDALAPWIVKRTGSNVGGTGASYKWTIGDPLEIKKLDPKLEFIEEYTTRKLVGYKRFPPLIRAQMHIPKMDRMQYILVYQFKSQSN